MSISSRTLSPSKFAALLAIAGLIIWVITADDQQAQAEAPVVSQHANNLQSKPLARVEVTPSQARLYTRQQVLQGQIAPLETVALSTTFSGTVERLYVSLGDQVQAGQALLQLSNAPIRAEKHSAEARLKLARAELSAAEKLFRKNLQTETAILRLTHEVEQAKTHLVQVMEQLADSTPTAPFSGVIDHLDLSVGEQLNVGQVWAKLVNIDALRVRAEVPQQLVHQLALGQSVAVKLLDGRELIGQLSFIASTANTDTRSFPIEVRLNNPDQLRLAGASATLNIQLGQVQAHHLSPALLSLSAEGKLGVKAVQIETPTSSNTAVQQQAQVVFYPVQLLSTGTDGTWVQGLPEQAHLISLGAGFVEAGQRVEVVMAKSTTDFAAKTIATQEGH